MFLQGRKGRENLCLIVLRPGQDVTHTPKVSDGEKTKKDVSENSACKFFPVKNAALLIDKKFTSSVSLKIW